jgi:arylformamidase
MAAPIRSDRGKRASPPAKVLAAGKAHWTRMLVYRDYDQAGLDAAYDQTMYATNRDQLYRRWDALSDAVRARLGIPERFAYGPSAAEYLDVFRCAQPHAPIVVYIHGGAWRKNPAERFAFPAEHIVAAGAHYVVVEFAGVDELDGDLRPIVQQVRSAIAWVFRNAERFDGDRERIVVVGHSSGAHVAGCLLVTDWAAFDLPPAPIASAVCCSGMYDLVPVSLSKRSAYVRFDAETIDALSACRRIERITIPISVAYGTEETPEFQRQSRDFAAALEAAGKRVVSLVGVGYNHFEIVETLANPFGLLGAAVRAHLRWFDER